MFDGIRACYEHRALIQALVARQLRARYRGSVLGFLWTFLNPLLLMLVYTLVFTVYMRVEMAHYGPFVFCGLLPWLWFTSSMIEGTQSIVSSGGLIARAMFPPEVLPVVAVLTNLANYIFSLPILLVMLLLAKIPMGPALVALPAIMAVQLVLILGGVFALSALNVQYRDVLLILQNLLTLWFFLCPVLYPLSNVPEKLKLLTLANPMGTLVLSYQDVLFYNRFPAWGHLAIAAAAGAVILVLGYAVFSRYRESFAEWL